MKKIKKLASISLLLLMSFSALISCGKDDPAGASSTLSIQGSGS